MNAKEFVEACYSEKENFLNTYLSESSESEVGKLIGSLGLNDTQFLKMKEILDASLTDVILYSSFRIGWMRFNRWNPRNV